MQIDSPDEQHAAIEEMIGPPGRTLPISRCGSIEQ